MQCSAWCSSTRTPAAVRAATQQVELGAFSEEARARRLARRVQRAGFYSYVVGVDVPELGHLYRVRLRPELPYDETRQLLAQL